jgi:chromosome segregation ATPase
MEYPKDPQESKRWQEMEDKVASAEKKEAEQREEELRWRRKHREAKSQLAAYKTSVTSSARDVKRELRAANGEMHIELARMESTCADLRAFVRRSNHESTTRHRLVEQNAVLDAENARLKQLLYASQQQRAAQARRILRLEAELTALGKQASAEVLASGAAAVDSEQKRVAAEAQRVAAEAQRQTAAAAAKAAEDSMTELKAASTQLSKQVKSAEVQLSKLHIRLEALVEDRLLVCDLPSTS